MARPRNKEKDEQGNARKYKSAASLKNKLEAYFAWCDDEGRLYSEQGMALYLGVSMSTLDTWWRGKYCLDLQDTIRWAYLRIADQIMTDPRYAEKSMVSLKIFLLKQEKFGGYQDKVESRQDISVNVKMGSGMEESDFA